MAELETGNMTRMQVRSIRQKRLKRKLILTGTIIILFLVLGVFFFIGTQLFTSFTPQITITNFIKDMQAGNYQTAYRFISNSGPLLTEKIFIEVQKNQGTIKEISYKKAEKGKFLVKVIRGDNTKDYNMLLINKGNRIFTDWRIDPTPFTDEISIFTPTKGATLKTNNIELGTSDGQKPITYRAFTGYRHTATMNLAGAQNLIFEMPANMKAQTGYMIATEELKNSLANLIQQYNSELSKTYMDWNMEHIKPFLKPGGEVYRWVNDTVFNLKDQRIPLDKKLMLFSIGKAYLEDSTHAVLEVGETWSDTYQPLKVNYKLENIDQNWRVVAAVIVD